MEKRSTKLVETMTLFIKIQAQSCQHGMLSIEPMVEQVSDPFLKKVYKCVLMDMTLKL